MALGLKVWHLILMAYVLCGAGWAHAAGLLIVAGDRSAGYSEVRDVLVNELERGGLSRTDITVRFSTEMGAVDGAVLEPVRLVITLGRDALKQVLAHDSRVPVIAAMTPRSVFERVVGDAGKKPSSLLTALYLDQPLGRQLDLLTLALPAAKKVGVLWGSESVVHQRNLTVAAQARGLELVNGTVGADGSIFVGLKAALDDADVMLAVADPQVFNSTHISNILLTTYRARIPVLAFSPAYVKAGALLSLHTTSTQLGVQAAAMARTVLQGGALASPQYPMDYVVGVNDYVARSLGLSVDGSSLADRLHRLEKRP